MNFMFISEHEIAAAILLTLAGLTIAHAAIRRMLFLMVGSYDEEEPYLSVWRMISGLLCGLVALVALVTTTVGMARNPAVIVFSAGYGMYPLVLTGFLGLLSVLSAFFDSLLTMKEGIFKKRRKRRESEDVRLMRPTNSADDYTPAERGYINS